MTALDVWTWFTTTDLRIVAAWVVGVPVGFAVLCTIGLYADGDLGPSEESSGQEHELDRANIREIIASIHS